MTLIVTGMMMVALAVAWFAMAGGFGLFRAPLSVHVLAAAPVLVVPLYVAAFWGTRERHVALDYHMLYLPLVVWAVATAVYKLIVWRLTHNDAFWHTYGWDKGLQNMLIEPALVVVANGVYLLRFTMASSARLRTRLAIVTLIIAGLIAIVVPPFGE